MNPVAVPAMLSKLLPTGISGVDAFGTDEEVLASGATALLAGGESDALHGRSPIRQHRSAAARVCVRRALIDLGAADGPVLVGRSGEPLWPDGIVGSITHCQGYRAAAVARQSDWCGVGIDAETDGPLRPGLVETIAHPSEIDRLRQLASRGLCQPYWDRLIFCAKEAAFKLVFPHVRRVVEFDELQIEFDPASQGLRARLVDEASGTTSPAGEGAWAVERRTMAVALSLRRGEFR